MTHRSYIDEASGQHVRGLERICIDAALRSMDVHVGPLRVGQDMVRDRFSYVIECAVDYIVHEPGSSATPAGWVTYRTSLMKDHPLVLRHAA